jgi:hypothetical protein
MMNNAILYYQAYLLVREYLKKRKAEKKDGKKRGRSKETKKVLEEVVKGLLDKID